MIAIVNYGSGNIQAIATIYQRLNIPFLIASSAGQLAMGERILLPGVGAFDRAMGDLERSGMREALRQAVIVEKKPILGICVGMQLLARQSEEGHVPGLGWIDGIVRKFGDFAPDPPLQLPHMGWNTIEPTRQDRLFESVDLDMGCYFLHSYYFCCDRDDDRLALTTYGCQFTSVVNRDNIYGVQFHPEKSHHAGVQLLKNFALMD